MDGCSFFALYIRLGGQNLNTDVGHFFRTFDATGQKPVFEDGGNRTLQGEQHIVGEPVVGRK